MTPTVGVPASLMRHRPFVFFWLSRISSTVALQMQAVAVGWQMYDLTNNPLDLGLVGLIQFIPFALLVLVVGQVADRYDRRRIMRICQFTAGVAMGILVLGTAGGWLSRNGILGVAFVIGTCRAFESTTLQALLPGIIPRPMLARATAAFSTATQLAVIAGPAVGGLIYATTSPVLVYALCAVLYFTAGTFMSLIRIERIASTREPVSLAVLFAGFTFIRNSPIVLGAISLDLFAVLLGGASALLPVFARDVFGGDSSALGLLRAAPGVGALLMAFAMTRWPPRRHVGRIMFGAVGIFGVATVVFALSQSFALSVAALTVLGAADVFSVVIRTTLVQLETPDETRGRVSAVNSLFVQASNQLGEFRAGVVASLIGAVPAVLIGGIGALLVVIAGRKIFAELYRVDTFGPAKK